MRPPESTRAWIRSFSTSCCAYTMTDLPPVSEGKSMRWPRPPKRSSIPWCWNPSRPMRSPRPVSFRTSTVPCSSTPARIVASISARLRMSSTTDSIPRRFSRWASSSPAGPAPTMPTWVRIEVRLLRLGVGLLRRLRAIERFELHALVEDTHDRRVGLGVALEPLGVEHLGHEAAIRQRRRIAVAETPGAGKVVEAGLDLRQPVRDPMAIPGIHLVFGLAHHLAQMGERARVVERVNLARDNQREHPHARAAERVLGKERRLRMRLVEVLDDRERLRQYLPVIEHQRRHQRLRIDRGVRGLALLAL